MTSWRPSGPSNATAITPETISRRTSCCKPGFTRHLQIIGEAGRALPEDIRRLAPQIEWGKIVGMRNVLVHDYFEIDIDIVWDAAQRDAPALKRLTKRLLRKSGRDKAKAKAPPPRPKKPGRKKKGGGG